MRFIANERDEITGRVKKLTLEALDARGEILLTTLMGLVDGKNSRFNISLSDPGGKNIYVVGITPNRETRA